VGKKPEKNVEHETRRALRGKEVNKSVEGESKIIYVVVG
jgi:hypothetical protein